MAKFKVLYPDVLSADDNAVERKISGDSAAFLIFNEKNPSNIGDDVWGSAEAMVTGLSMPIGAAVIAKLEECKIIARLGVGYDLIDIAAAGAKGIAVCNVPDYGTNEVADHALALLLSLTRGISQYTETYRNAGSEGWDYKITPVMTRMVGKCFGVRTRQDRHGCGHAGQGVWHEGNSLRSIYSSWSGVGVAGRQSSLLRGVVKLC